MADQNGTLVVAGKTFSFTRGTESELEAYMDAKRYLREMHREAVGRILPPPGSKRKADRQYDPATGALHPSNPHYVETGKRTDAENGDVLLEAPPARIKAKGGG